MIGCLPSCENKPSAPLAQSVEHLPFKQGVRGSNPRRGTKKSLETQRFQGFSLFAHFLFVSNVLVTASTSVCASMCVYMFAVQKPGPQAAFDQNREGETAQGFPPHTPLSLPHREAIPSNTTKLGIPHGASLFGIWWIRNERRLRATQRDVEAGRNIPPAHRGTIPQFFCWKNRRTCGIIS